MQFISFTLRTRKSIVKNRVAEIDHPEVAKHSFGRRSSYPVRLFKKSSIVRSPRRQSILIVQAVSLLTLTGYIRV